MKVIGNALEGTWYSEVGEMWPGRALSLRVDKLLYEGKSDFQSLRVFENEGTGRVLTLDNIIQVTEKDECAYHESLAHIPLFAHPDPRAVLVIGGGDGGTIREAARHPGVERIDLCEIDDEVIRVSKEFLPFTASGFDDPRVNVIVADGARYVEEHKGEYDAILVDSSDPVGPAAVLFREPFYRGLRGALRPGGIVATQAESLWLHRDIIVGLIDIARGLFDQAGYCWCHVPTYPSGTIGFLVASLGPEVKKPSREPDEAARDALQYYTPELHEASFRLPAFAERWLAE